MSEINEKGTNRSGGMMRRKRADAVPAQSELGKLPPQATDLEEAVLGSLMLDKNCVSAVMDILKPESFYVDAHQRIFDAITQLFQAHKPIDILTVTHQLKKNNELEIVGGPYFISRLTNRVASAANVEYHARIVVQKFIQRELIRVSTEIIRESYEDHTDVLDLLDKAESNLFKIVETNIRRSYQSMAGIIKEAIANIEKAAQQKDGISGVPSGFSNLDKVTSGWQASDLIVVAARPGMGKTAFVLALARNAAVDFNTPVAFFSLEMSSVQLVTRMISSETELPSDTLKKGSLADHQWEQLNSKITRLADAKIFIDDTAAINIFEVRAKCRRLKAEHNIGLIIIDYLQLMTAGNEGKGNREQEISTISRSLKAIAKELNVPIIVLSQLNRAVETRAANTGGQKRPQLSDLRESGAIEQDADIIIFLYRDEYYRIYQDENGNSTQGMATVIIAKHRNGALEDVPVRWIAGLSKFADANFSGDGSNFDMPTGYDFDGDAPSITMSSRLNDMSEDSEPPF
jgi:replicative DNA helicase